MLEKVALFRTREDFRKSWLHDYGSLRRAQHATADYLVGRTDLSAQDAARRAALHPILERHWQNRAPWSDRTPPSVHVKRASLKIATICINTGVLFTLANLRDKLPLDLEVACQHLSPMEYWESPDFPDHIDAFVTELSAPLVSGVSACDEYCLAFPIHTAAEGFISKTPVLDISNLSHGRRGVVGAIVTAGTSTVTHAGKKAGVQITDKLPRTDMWADVIGAMNDEVFFTWEPWLFAIEQSKGELSVYRDNEFRMGMFVRTRALEQDKRDVILLFLDEFVREWRAHRSALAVRGGTRKEILGKLGSLALWRETFSRAMLVANDSVEPRHVIEDVVKHEILELLEAFQRGQGHDAVHIENMTHRYDQIRDRLDGLRPSALNGFRTLLHRLLKSRKKPWERVAEVEAFMSSNDTSLQNTRPIWKG